MNWISNVEDAFHTAQVEKKLILLYFYSDWCGWCTKLLEEIYANQNIVLLLNEEFVCLKVDIDDPPTITDDYQYNVVPTTIFLSSNRKELGRIDGYLSPEQFYEYTQDIFTKHSSNSR